MANVSPVGGDPIQAQGSNQTYTAALSMVTVLFFFWGFVTSLNDILIPHLKNIFALNYTKIMLIQFAFFTGYFLFSLPAAKIVDALGYKKTMVIGLVTIADTQAISASSVRGPAENLTIAAIAHLGKIAKTVK